MTIEIIAFLGGLVLLAVAIVGGGIELKEVKVPPIPVFPRLLAATSGIALMIFAAALRIPPDPPPANGGVEALAAIAPAASIPQGIRVVLTDQLGSGQYRERLAIILDGKKYAEIEVSQGTPEQMVEIELPKAGTYAYLIHGSLVVKEDGGRFRHFAITCQGEVPVQDGDRFGFAQEEIESDSMKTRVCLVPESN